MTIPFLNNPASALTLLSGGDIQLLEFYPPPVVFAFRTTAFRILWPIPLVQLKIEFEVSTKLEFSVVLDTRGIREAVAERSYRKATASFALRDAFEVEGKLIDRPLCTLSVGVFLTIDFVSAAGCLLNSSLEILLIDYYLLLFRT